MKLLLSLLNLIILVRPTVAQLRTFTGHSGFVGSVAVSDGFLFSGSNDGTIRQWNISTAGLIRIFRGHTSLVYSVEVSDGFLYSSSYDKTIRQWSIISGNYIRTFIGHTSFVHSVAVSGDFLFSGSADKSIKQWLISSGATIRNFTGHASGVLSVAISGDFLFSGSSDTTIRQWSISSGGLIRTLTGHANDVRDLDISGDFLFSGSADNTIKQWSISTGGFIRTYNGHANSVWKIATSGDFLYSGSHDTTIRQWSISSGRFVRFFFVRYIVFSVAASGDFVFSGSGDFNIRQWCAGNTYQNGSQCVQCPANARCFAANFTCNSGYYLSAGACYLNIITSSVTLAITKTISSISSTSIATMEETVAEKTSSIPDVSSNYSLSARQPDNNISSDTTIYIVAGGAGLVVIMLIGGFTVYLYRENKRKARILEQILQTVEVLTGSNGQMNNPNSSSNYLNEFISDTAKLPPPFTSTKTSPSLTNTTTMYSSTGRGLYIPGNFLLKPSIASSLPLYKVLHSNRNCKVQVCQALDKELRQRCRKDLVAVKTLHGMDQNNLTCFYQEISIMYYFRGKPNIAQLVGFCDSPYQVLTDYYSLGSLAQALLLDSRVIQPCKLIAIQFSLQISGALEQMHQNGFSHSDIKALNVFVDRDKNNGGALQCYLGDFGLAQILDDTHLVVKSYRVLNRKGLTAAYAAPEMLTRFRGSGGENASEGDWKAGDFLRADIYSLGVLLYEILSCSGAWK